MPPSSPTRESFLRYLGDSRAHSTTSLAALDEALRVAIDESRARWPQLAVDETSFGAFLAERVPTGGDVVESLRSLHHSDLYLACACSRADRAALSAFEEHYMPEVERVRRSLPGISVDELRQTMREKFFVGLAGSVPQISAYRGTGELRHWVRVAAMRTGLKLLRQTSRRSPGPWLGLTGTSHDMEVEYMRRVYGAQFDAALRDAWDALSFRHQNVLRYALSEGLDPGAIATLYRVHRTTAARWLTAARDAWMKASRTTMRERLHVTERELESILRLLGSGIQLPSPPA